jgi:ABC-type phosphate transport system substrate-binding protein
MKKALATMALAAVPALILSACNGTGQSGVASLPNASSISTQSNAQGGPRMRHNDNGPQDLHAGGATFPAYAYNTASQPVGTFSMPQAPPGGASLFAHYGGTGTIYYCLTGSGAGRLQFDGDPSRLPATAACAGLGDTPTGFGGRADPLDFVGSDVMLTSAEYGTYASNRKATQGEPFIFPSIGGAIVYGYRPQDISTTVKLSAWSYCAIANGTIGNWNDAALTADNGGTSLTGGVSQPITFYYRSDGSGTSYLYQNHLDARCTASWPAPYNASPYESAGHSANWGHAPNTHWSGPTGTQPSGSNFIGVSGNPGVLAGIQSTPWATGYLEGAYAKSANPHVSQASLQDESFSSFISPTNRAAVVGALKHVTKANLTLGGCSDGVSCGSSKPGCILYIDPSHFVTPGAGDYPIVGTSYLMFYGKNNAHSSDDIKLIHYIASTPANTIVNKLEYASLSSSIHKAINSAVSGCTGP